MEIFFETGATGNHSQFILIRSCTNCVYYEKSRLFEDIGTFCGVANILNCNWDYVCPGLLCQGELVTYAGFVSLIIAEHLFQTSRYSF